MDTERRMVVRWSVLGVIYYILMIAGPVNYLWSAFNSGFYRSLLSTNFYFSISLPSGGMYIPNVLTNVSIYYDFSSIFIRESAKQIFIPTYVEELRQAYRSCDYDISKEGSHPARCAEEDEPDKYCRLYYGNNESFCVTSKTNNTEVGDCFYSPFPQWCTDSKETQMLDIQNIAGFLGVVVTARSICKDDHGETFVFSNNNQNNVEEQHFVHLDLINDVLLPAHSKEGPIQDYMTTPEHRREIYLKGLDIVLKYDWKCNLNQLTAEDRYLCPLNMSGEVLTSMSNSASTTSSSRIPQTFYERSPPERVLQNYRGMRLRFVGNGGCEKTTVVSVLNYLANAIAASKITTIIGSVILVLSFKYVFKMDVPADIIAYDENKKAWTLVDYGQTRELAKKLLKKKQMQELTKRIRIENGLKIDTREEAADPEDLPDHLNEIELQPEIKKDPPSSPPKAKVGNSAASDKSRAKAPYSEGSPNSPQSPREDNLRRDFTKRMKSRRTKMFEPSAAPGPDEVEYA